MQRLLSMTTSAIDIVLHYCTTLIQWLEQKKETDTDVPEFHLSEIKSNLDELRTTLRNQSTTNGIKLNVIEPLIEQLQAIAQKRNNISSLLNLQQSYSLQGVMERLIETRNKLLKILDRHDNSLDELTTYLNEINRTIEQEKAAILIYNAKVGAVVGATTIPVFCGLVHLLRKDKHVPAIMGTIAVSVAAGAILGAGIGRCRGWWITSSIKKESRKESKN